MKNPLRPKAWERFRGETENPDTVEIQSPYIILEVLSEQKRPGYIYRREMIDASDIGMDEPMEMVNCYSDYAGEWIGDAKTALLLCRDLGLRQVQKADDEHCVCSIGFNEDEQKWYGWSHRATCGFGRGDRLFEERYGDEDTLFTEHGEKEINTLEEAQQAARNFGHYVSHVNNHSRRTMVKESLFRAKGMREKKSARPKAWARFRERLMQ